MVKKFKTKTKIILLKSLNSQSLKRRFGDDFILIGKPKTVSQKKVKITFKTRRKVR